MEAKAASEGKTRLFNFVHGEKLRDFRNKHGWSDQEIREMDSWAEKY